MTSSASTSARGPLLRIVSVNDVYSLENLPRLATLIGHYKEASPKGAFIAILAGDFVGPSMLSSLDRGRGMIACLNAAGITHVIFGNHEDDIPTDELHRRISEFQGTWLSTNVHDFDPALPPYQVLEVAQPGGRTVRVGFLGVVMTDPGVYRRAPFGGAAIEPANEAALREATRLREREDCELIIPITHQSMADDRALAALASDTPFPLIVGGHEHDVHVEQVAASWIVKAGSDAIQAAIIEVTFAESAPHEGESSVPVVTVRLEAVAGYTEDAPLRALVDSHMTRVHELETAVLLPLVAGQKLSSVGSRARQTSIGALVCSRARDALGAEACLLNGGGIRAARDYEHHLTFGDIKAEFPFENEMVVARLPGSVVQAAIAASRSRAPAEYGGFLQVDDRMTVEGQGAVVSKIDGEPFLEDREYRVALVRSFFTGMDHIEPLVAFATAHPERVPHVGSGRELRELLVDAFSLALWHKLGGFDAVDRDHDGTVTEAEVSQAIADVTAERASPVTVGLVMNAVDKDHDHLISRDESEAVGTPRPKKD